MKTWNPDDSRWKTKWEELKSKLETTEQAEPEPDDTSR